MKILNKLKNDRQDLINNLNENIVSLEKIAYEQQVEIERLQGLLKEWKKAGYKYADSIDLIKAEAIKEFAERLKEEVAHIPAWGSVAEKKIDNLVKEMVGDDNATH